MGKMSLDATSVAISPIVKGAKTRVRCVWPARHDLQRYGGQTDA
jgi:hypothetical protein